MRYGGQLLVNRLIPYYKIIDQGIPRMDFNHGILKINVRVTRFKITDWILIMDMIDTVGSANTF